MPLFKIEVREVLSTTIDIEADNLESAIAIAQEQYNNQEIVLDYADLAETNFEEENEY